MNPAPAPTSAAIGDASVPTVASTFASMLSAGRDGALDVLRGFAIIAMLSTHVGPKAHATTLLHLPLWVSAAGFFVLTSGFVIGMKSARELSQRPARDLYRWLLKRALLIYAIHCVLTLAVIAVRATTGLLDAPDVGAVGGVVKAVVLVLLLRLQPGDFMNILPLYVVFLAAAPFALEASRRSWSFLVLVASTLLWLLAQNQPNVLPLPDPDITPPAFSLAAWQFVFLIGLLGGFHRQRLGQVLRSLGAPLPVAVFAFTAALFTLAQLERDVFKPAGWTGAAGFGHLLAKQTFAPLHALYTLGLLAVGYVVINRFISLASHSDSSGPMGVLNTALENVARMGRKSLYCFQIHLVFALLASAAGARAWPAWSQDLLVIGAIVLLHEFARREIWQRYVPN